MTRRRAILGALAAVFAAGGADAQRSAPAERGAPPLRVFDRRDLNVLPQIHAVARTSDGVAHVLAADLYVLRSDGVRWHETFVPLGRLRAVEALSDDRLWVGGVGGSGELTPQSDGSCAFSPWPIVRGPAHALGDDIVASARAPDPDGRVVAAAGGLLLLQEGVGFASARAPGCSRCPTEPRCSSTTSCGGSIRHPAAPNQNPSCAFPTACFQRPRRADRARGEARPRWRGR